MTVIFNSGVPVVLRKIISGEMTDEHHYEFLEDHCVHGVMDGDAFTTRRHSFNLAGLGTGSQKPGFSIALQTCSCRLILKTETSNFYFLHW